MKFHIGDLLSISTGKLLSPTHIDGVYKILNHMTGDNLMTHQLPNACRIAEPYLLDQHPWLKGVRPEGGMDVPDLMSWLSAAGVEHGEWHDVEPMPAAVWGVHDPIADLVAMTDKPIVVVQL